MKTSITMDESDVEQMITEFFDARGQEVDYIYISYDKPEHATALDPGNGLSIEVGLK